MEFSWTREQHNLYEDSRRFARQELVDAVGERERAHQFGAEEWRKAAAFGLAGLSISPPYGGKGLDCLTTARVFEAIGRECPDGGFLFGLAAHLLACCIPIDRFGTELQKAKYLPNLCSGVSIGAAAITERDAGSDVFGLQARAVQDGDTYVLNGEKAYVTNAPVARTLLVYAVTDPGLSVCGVSAFLLDRDSQGLTIGAPMAKGGLTTAQMATVWLSDCRVPAEQRLGVEGAGAVIFQESMGWERTCLFALWLGSMERQLDEAIQRGTSRRQFGRPIGTNQAISHRIANMKLRLERARLLVYRACWERSQGRPSDLWTSLAKLAVSEAFVQSSLDAVQIFGAVGLLRDAGIERYVRDALPGTIYSGTSEMQREVVARALGLPRMPPRRRATCQHVSNS